MKNVNKIFKLGGVSPGEKTITRITNVPVKFTAGAKTENIGRLAIDNELVRFKYGV